MVITGTGIQATVAGFEVTGGYAITGTDHGGGLYVNVDSDGQVLIADNAIHHNTATGNGGGLWAEAEVRSTLVLSGNEVMTNTAFYGGGIYARVSVSGTFTLRGNAVVSNTAGSGGGLQAWVLYLSAFQVEDNTFARNTAADEYGGLYLRGDENVSGSFDRNLIIDNVASDDNGGAYFNLDDNTATTFDDNVFQGNRAGGSYGGLHLYVYSHSRVVGNHLVLDGNVAGGSYGGAYAYMSEGSAFTMTEGLSVTNNVAGASGGGIRINAGYSRASVPNMFVYNNRALAGSYGGFYFSDSDAGGMFYVRNATVISNTARNGSGGGGYISVGDGSYADFSGSRFERNQADYGGGLYGSYLDEGSTLLLNETVFLSNTAATHGGGANLSMPDEFSWLEMNDTLIMSNTAGQDGGGLYTRNKDDGSEFSFSRNLVENNSAGQNGGGIYLGECSQGCLLSVDDNVLVHNSAGNQGGGYYQNNNFADEGSQGTFNRNQVISNTAGGAGGGIYMTGDIASYGGRAQFNDNLIAGNRSHGGGGGMRIDDMADSATAQFIGNTVINNLAVDGDGGGIRMDDIAYYGSLVYFQDNVISGNVISSTGSYNGGGIRIYGVGDGDTVWITGNTFNDNVATGKGGGFFFDSDIDYASEVYFEDNDLQFNQAQNGGGCYWDYDWEDGGPVTFKNNVVNNNVAWDSYGGCYFDTIDEGTLAYISGNQFNYNTAVNDVGGVHIERVYDGAVLDFSDNQIIGNQAGISGTQVISGGNYGGLYLGRIYQGGVVHLYDNQILSNSAYFTYVQGITPTGGSYGGMYAQVERAGLLQMTDNTIAGNNAEDSYGGLALDLEGAGRVELEHNLIQANSAANQGGGLALGITNTWGMQYYFWRNRIEGNSAAAQGGLWIENDDLTALPWGFSVNNLVAGNSGGVYLANAGWDSTNDTIADNLEYGIMMTGTLSSAAYLSNTIVWGHTWSFSTTKPATHTLYATYSDIEGGWPGAGNIGLDPLFVGGGDYHLTATSPAVDWVDPAWAPLIDLDGVPRPVPIGGLADIGAYEWFRAGVLLYPDQASTELPATTVTYTLVVSNSGNVADTFSLDLPINSLGWPATVLPDNVWLDVGQSTLVQVVVTVPADALGGQVNQITARATSDRDGTIVDWATIETTVANVAGLSLEPDRASGVAPGSRVRYEHVLANGGNFTDTITLQAASSAGWPVLVMPSVATVPAGDIATVVVTVTVPAGALAGEVDTTTITATSSAGFGTIVDTAQDTSTVLETQGVEIEPDRSAIVLPGELVVYTHTVTNRGNSADSFDLGVVSSQGWTVTVLPDILALGDGESAEVQVQLNVPATATAEIDLSLVTVTSRNNDTVSDSALDISQLCLPISGAALDWLPITPTVGQLVHLTGTVAGGAAPVDYAWDFGDGSGAAGAEVWHAYAAAGSYNLVLTASNACGLEVAMATLVVVEPGPCEPVNQLDFGWTPLTPTVGEPVVLEGLAEGSLPITFSWDLGDGTLAAGATVVHSYDAAGVYTVSLTAENACGVQAVSRSLVVVEPPACEPVEILSVTTAFSGCQVTFGAELSGDAPFGYAWNFGAYGSSSAPTVTVDFGGDGSYSYALAVENCAGEGLDTYLGQVTVSCGDMLYSIYLPVVFKAHTP